MAGTVASGAIGGAITGGTVSTMFGGSFSDGAISGGIGGGLNAGISWMGQHAKINVEADNLGLSGDKSAGDPTDENLQNKGKNWFNQEEGKNGLNTLEVANKKNISSTYTIKDGELFQGDMKVDGYTEMSNEGWIGNSDVRIATTSFSGERRLYMILSHEFIHVKQFYLGDALKWKEEYGWKEAYQRMDAQAYYWGNYIPAKQFGWSYYKKWSYAKYIKYRNRY